MNPYSNVPNRREGAFEEGGRHFHLKSQVGGGGVVVIINENRWRSLCIT